MILLPFSSTVAVRPRTTIQCNNARATDVLIFIWFCPTVAGTPSRPSPPPSLPTLPSPLIDISTIAARRRPYCLTSSGRVYRVKYHYGRTPRSRVQGIQTILRPGRPGKILRISPTAQNDMYRIGLNDCRIPYGFSAESTRALLWAREPFKGGLCPPLRPEHFDFLLYG